MQQTQESVFDICLHAFDLSNTAANRESIKMILTAVTSVNTPDNFKQHFQYLIDSSASSTFTPSLEILNNEEFQSYLFHATKQPQKILTRLLEYGIKLQPKVLMNGIINHIDIDFIQFIITHSQAIPFSFFLECLAVLEIQHSDKKNKVWAQKTQKFLIENAEHFVVADCSEVIWQYCFHNNGKYFSTQKNILMELYFVSPKTNQTRVEVFDCCNNMELFGGQTVFSFIQLAFYFEIPSPILLKFISREQFLICLKNDAVEILEQLKHKREYLEHLDSTLEITEPKGFKEHLLTWAKLSINYDFLVKKFQQPSFFWKQTIKKNNKRISSEYQRIWKAIEKSENVIPALKEELQSLISFPQPESIQFEEWLFYNTKIPNSLEIINKWGIHFRSLETSTNNLFLLGIYHQQPISYFKYLIEKLNYNICISDYFNSLACLNAMIAQGTHGKWLTSIWKYLIEKGNSFINITGKQNYSYHFNSEENALMILSEFNDDHYLQVFYQDEKNILKHQEFVVHDYNKLKQVNFKYFFESQFIIDQMNPQIILQSIFLFLEQEKQLGFMQNLRALIQNECFLKEHQDYRALLNQPVIIRLNEQQLTKSLDEYLFHHIRRILHFDRKWQKLTEVAYQSFQAKISIIEDKSHDDYHLVLKQYMENDNPELKTNILPRFKSWLFESSNSYEFITELLAKNYQLDDHLHHDISILGLAVLNQFPIVFIKTLVEKNALKCSPIDFLNIMAFLEMHLHDPSTTQWALEIKQYLLDLRFSIVIPEHFPCDCEYLFYDNFSTLIIHDTKENCYCLIEKIPQESKLKRSFFQLTYASDKKIEFDSILQMGIKLQLPIDFLSLLITENHVKEKSFGVQKHIYYELLKLEQSSPDYFQQAFNLVITQFVVFDLNGNNLLHFLVSQDRADLIDKHYSVLLPFVDQINSLGQTPVTQELNCSKQTFELLMKMQPCNLEINQFYKLFLNPEYTATLLNTFPKSIFNQKLESGMTIIEEMFISGCQQSEIFKIILSNKPNFFDDMNKSELLILSIHQKMTLNYFKVIHEMLDFTKESFEICHFTKACELQIWELANYLFKPELLQNHFSFMIQNPNVMDFFQTQNIMVLHPELADLISPHLPSFAEFYQKSFLKQIYTLAKSRKHWLCEFNEFPLLILLGLKLELLQANVQCKGGENLIYYVELYCHQHQDYSFLNKLCDKQFKMDFNKKNAAQDHIIISIIKQENGLARLMTFLTECNDVVLQLNKLNPKDDNLLDLAIESGSSPFIEWCFSQFHSNLSLFIDEDLRKKTSKIMLLFRKNKELFIFLSSQFNSGHWQRLVQLSESKEFLNLKQYLQLNHLDLSVSDKKEVHYDWQEFKVFLMNASAKQILNLPSMFKAETLPKMLLEHSLIELYQILKERPPLCMKEFSKIKSVATLLQQVADDCYCSNDVELLKKLQLSLPKDIVIKNKMISTWASLIKLLSEEPELAFKLLSNQKLEQLLTHNSAIDLYLLIISMDPQFLTKLHEYPAIQTRIPDILQKAHLENIQAIIKVIYLYLPKHFAAHKRLYTLAHTAPLNESSNLTSSSNSMLALNLFNKLNPKISDELQRRKKLLPSVWISEDTIPQELKILYKILCPYLHPEHKYLGLYGSSIRHIYNQKPHSSDYDCFAVLTCNLENIFNLLKKLNFGHTIFVKSLKPIIRISLAIPNSEPLQIDLSSFDLDISIEADMAIQQELEKHDFTISGAYAKINDQIRYQIHGCQKTLAALHSKTLSLMHPCRLEEDPLRLMRAIKLHIDDESYVPDEELTGIINSGQPQKALAEFLHDELHCKQFVTQLNKLLKNPNQQLMVFELMDQYHFFETWTGFKYEEVKAQLESLPVMDSKLMLACQLKFIKYLYILTCLKQKSFKDLESTVIYKISRGFLPTERMFFEYIDSQLMGISLDMYIEGKDTLQLISHAKNSH